MCVDGANELDKQMHMQHAQAQQHSRHMHTCIMCICTCPSTKPPLTPLQQYISFVDVSFVDNIQPMVCIPCLHMHLQSLCSTSVGANAQMQCKCMCMHFTHTHKAHMICTCMYLWIVYSPWCMHHVYICICSCFSTISSCSVCDLAF